MDQDFAVWDTLAVRGALASGDYGAVVRAIRRANNLTLADLARRSNYSISTLSRLERPAATQRCTRAARPRSRLARSARTARIVRPTVMHSAARRARRDQSRSNSASRKPPPYWSDVARAFHQWGKPAHCYRALWAAEQAAPDEVRYRKPIQKITADLLRHPQAAALPGLLAFAKRTATHT